jgi:hypothetical protein
VDTAKSHQEALDKIKSKTRDALRRESCPGKLEIAENEIKETRGNLKMLYDHVSEVYQSIISVLPDAFESEDGDEAGTGVGEACRVDAVFAEFEKEFQPIDLEVYNGGDVEGKKDEEKGEEKKDEGGMFLVY